MANDLGISPEYFSGLFSKNMGESFVHFLRNYRIEIAKSLYLHSDIPREEVPFKVGFVDEKYYNRV
ncbi:helix-turn-helix domain-containing protein, partial [Clostridioides difficile]|nr:helix-turn-helix domain-containing protein [Clostridioides difficile]